MGAVVRAMALVEAVTLEATVVLYQQPTLVRLKLGTVFALTGVGVSRRGSAGLSITRTGVVR